MIAVVLIVLGLCLGSFVNALVWRLHEQTMIDHKAKGKQLSSKQLSILKGRSMCPKCRHQLAAKDLIPLFSWIWLLGRCRYCKATIPWQYPLVEFLTASLFIFSYYFWPTGFRGLNLEIFVLWLGAIVLFMALAVYDILWHILPNAVILPLTVLSTAIVSMKAFTNISTVGDVLLGSLWGVLLLAGLFYVLFQLSGGKWIGGGDVKLAVPLGILAGGPLTAVLLLLLASTGGTMLAVPLMLEGKANANTKVPFGPFLIFASFIIGLFGASIMHWYKHFYL